MTVQNINRIHFHPIIMSISYPLSQPVIAIDLERDSLRGESLVVLFLRLDQRSFLLAKRKATLFPTFSGGGDERVFIFACEAQRGSHGTAEESRA